MPYVADAHSWVYYLTGKLSKKADKIFTSVENGGDVIYVPTVALAECLYLSDKRKISVDAKHLLNKFEISLNFIPRIIVATSKLLNAKLITKDEEITKFGLVETVW